MKSFEYTFMNPCGLHVRPAGLLVKQIRQYASAVTVFKDGKNANGLKLMALMGLGIRQGDTVSVTVEGTDEDTAAAELATFFKEHFREGSSHDFDPG